MNLLQNRSSGHKSAHFGRVLILHRLEFRLQAVFRQYPLECKSWPPEGELKLEFQMEPTHVGYKALKLL